MPIMGAARFVPGSRRASLALVVLLVTRAGLSTSVELPDDEASWYWVCSHAKASCTGRRTCVPVPVETCVGLELVSFERLVPLGLSVASLPLAEQPRPLTLQQPPTNPVNRSLELSLLGPPRQGVCGPPLLGPFFPNRVPAGEGECLSYGSASLPFRGNWYLSIHNPECPLCHQAAALPLLGNESKHCAMLDTQSCMLDRNCHWGRGVLNTYCTDPVLAVNAVSAYPEICGWLQPAGYCEDYGTEFCTREEGHCRARDLEGARSEGFDRGFWQLDQYVIKGDTIWFSDLSLSSSLPARYDYAHACAALVPVQGVVALHFSGREQLTLEDATCEHHGFVGTFEYLIMALPTARHRVPSSATDVTTGLKDQRLFFVPDTKRSTSLAAVRYIGVSIATNGVTVFGYDAAGTRADPLLIWEGTLDRWTVLIIEAKRDGRVRLFLVDELVAETQMPEGYVYRACHSQLGGRSPHGTFKGAVSGQIRLRKPEDTAHTDLVFYGSGQAVLRLQGCRIQARSSDLQLLEDGFLERNATMHTDFSTPPLQVVPVAPRGTARFFLAKAPIEEVSIDAATGVVSGVFRAEGTFAFVVGAETEDGLCDPHQLLLRFHVVPELNLVVNTAADLHTTADARYTSETPVVLPVGGNAPFKFVAQSLPDGLAIDPATGVLSGSANTGGLLDIGITIIDANGACAMTTVTVTVNPRLALPGLRLLATAGSLLETSPVVPQGGVPPYRYQVVRDKSNADAPVLSVCDLDSVTGLLRLQATPNLTSEFSLELTISVEDKEGSSFRTHTSVLLAPRLKLRIEASPRALGMAGLPIWLQPNGTLSSQSNRADAVVEREPRFELEASAAFPTIRLVSSGGHQPHHMFVHTGPPGLSINPAGYVQGRVVQTGMHTVVFGVRDAAEAMTLTRPVTFAVRPSDHAHLTANFPAGATAATVVAVVVLIAVAASIAITIRFPKQEEPGHFSFRKLEFIKPPFLGLLDHPAIPRELEPRCITNLEPIGSGAYGAVCKAYLREGDGRPHLVAVKQLASESDDLVQEAMMLCNMKHRHIIELVGVVSKQKPSLLVLEYMEHGSLRDFLTQCDASTFSQQSKLLIATDIAKGMAYLEGLGVIHRDLAARNVLLDSSYRCVLADFGRARQLEGPGCDYLASSSEMPIRWMPPEVLLSDKYSTKADVWAYGVTLVEVWLLGALPWPQLSNAQYFDRVTTGRDLPLPPTFPEYVATLTKLCLSYDSAARPQFATMVPVLCSVHVEEFRHTDLQQDYKALLHSKLASQGSLAAIRPTYHGVEP